MGDVITIGVDLAKLVFQVHGVDAAGTVVVRRQLRRRQVLPFFETLRPCLVGMEACATAHHWGREIQRLGHRVRLMPPRYVKAYVKIQKNDAADAEAICEAVARPTMRFVELKTSEQQSILVLHRTRQLFVRQRTTLINAIRAHLAEFGIVAPIGRNGVEKLLETIGDGQDARIPDVARTCLEALAMQLHLVNRRGGPYASAAAARESRRGCAHSQSSWSWLPAREFLFSANASRLKMPASPECIYSG
jgi:transposase